MRATHMLSVLVLGMGKRGGFGGFSRIGAKKTPCVGTGGLPLTADMKTLRKHTHFLC